MDAERFFGRMATELQAGRIPVLATVVASSGSTPRGAGARMALLADGTLLGSVGGGVLEARVLAAMPDILQDGGARARVLHFDLADADAAASGMVCGGHATVVVEQAEPAQVQAVLAQLQAGRAATIRRDSFADIPDEVIVPAAPLWIFGAGHVGAATARLAATVGFAVTLLDDRAEFADPALYGDAIDVRWVADMAEAASGLPTGAHVVIVTRGHVGDGAVLQQALGKSTASIGMIGSRRKRETLYADLRASGVDEAALAAVHCPIGLAIGAQTPEEIAVAIVAQLIAVRAGITNACS